MGEGDTVPIALRCHHQNDFALRLAAVRDCHKTVSVHTAIQEKRESERNRT